MGVEGAAAESVDQRVVGPHGGQVDRLVAEERVEQQVVAGAVGDDGEEVGREVVGPRASASLSASLPNVVASERVRSERPLPNRPLPDPYRVRIDCVRTDRVRTDRVRIDCVRIGCFCISRVRDVSLYGVGMPAGAGCEARCGS